MSNELTMIENYVTPFSFIWIAAIGVLAGILLDRCLSLLWTLNFHVTVKVNDQETLLIRPGTKLPRHLAVIMDGNRRFGRKLHADPLKGHWAGGQTLIDFVQWCIQDGIEILTVYAFSTENWDREATEVNTLMTIFSKYAESFKTEAVSRNVRVQVLTTDYARLPSMVQASVRELEAATRCCSGFLLNICLSYGGRAEIVSAATVIARDVVAGKVNIEKVTETTFSERLLTSGLPEPDVLIRTSGERRLSNFLIWQLAYTELFFVDKFWPEMTHKDLIDVIHGYSERCRRFGK